MDVEIKSRFTSAGPEVLDWLRITSAEGDWRRFERLAALALYLPPEGLGPVLATVLAERPAGVNTEDLVDLLGELRAPEGVEPVAALVRERKSTDGPHFTFCVKALQSLGEIGTPKPSASCAASPPAIPRSGPTHCAGTPRRNWGKGSSPS
ncbi:hypothetical protein ACFY0P_14665 [Streptomyces sp. NPDC001714]|uniref:hypothetical protein n=1 Tax=Streptomyces sp. NPDC001714 TaxID=3364603 RepID=UPI0036A3C8F8